MSLKKTDKKVADGGSILADSRIEFLKSMMLKNFILFSILLKQKIYIKKLKYIGHE